MGAFQPHCFLHTRQMHTVNDSNVSCPGIVLTSSVTKELGLNFCFLCSMWQCQTCVFFFFLSFGKFVVIWPDNVPWKGKYPYFWPLAEPLLGEKEGNDYLSHSIYTCTCSIYQSCQATWPSWHTKFLINLFFSLLLHFSVLIKSH